MTHSTLRRGFTFWEAVIVLGILGFFAAILIPVFNRPRENDGNGLRCPSKLKQIMLSVKQYTQDYDEKHPLIATSQPDFGWAGALQPYTKSTQIFQCPSEATAAKFKPTQPGYTDYWFNARIAGKQTAELTGKQLTISLGEGNSKDARAHLLSIPDQWRKDEKSPLYRHLDGANYAFADGHVKWLRPDKWESELDMASGPTLRLKPTNQAASK